VGKKRLDAVGGVPEEGAIRRDGLDDQRALIGRGGEDHDLEIELLAYKRSPVGRHADPQVVTSPEVGQEWLDFDLHGGNCPQARGQDVFD
jgi:hypothetical protein